MEVVLEQGVAAEEEEEEEQVLGQVDRRRAESNLHRRG